MFTFDTHQLLLGLFPIVYFLQIVFEGLVIFMLNPNIFSSTSKYFSFGSGRPGFRSDTRPPQLGPLHESSAASDQRSVVRGRELRLKPQISNLRTQISVLESQLSSFKSQIPNKSQNSNPKKILDYSQSSRFGCL